MFNFLKEAITGRKEIKNVTGLVSFLQSKINALCDVSNEIVENGVIQEINLPSDFNQIIYTNSSYGLVENKKIELPLDYKNILSEIRDEINDYIKQKKPQYARLSEILKSFETAYKDSYQDPQIIVFLLDKMKTDIQNIDNLTKTK